MSHQSFKSSQSNGAHIMSATELTQKLVQFDTTSYKSNRELISFVENYLSSLGVPSMVFPNEDGSKANLVATVGEGTNGLMFAGHCDVVPIADQKWSHDAFSGLLKDGKLFGRGTCDMKGFLATVLSIVPELLNRASGVPVHLAVTFDEEAGCFGGKQLVEDLAKSAVAPKFCVVGEPTSMQIATKHKGKTWLRCIITGSPCHSSSPEEGVNSIELAAEMIMYLQNYYTRFKSGPFDMDLEPPYSTLQACTITGGTSYNIIPSGCTFDFEIRNIPAQNPRPVFDEITEFAQQLADRKIDRDKFPNAGIKIVTVSDYPGLSTDNNSKFVKAAKDSLKTDHVTPIGFSTEAGLYSESGMEVIVCGPGSIEQAHKADEFVTVEQLERCRSFLLDLCERVG